MSELDFYTSQLEIYNKLVDQLQDIERKGKTMPYTSLNGHMFSFLSKEGKIGLRLSKFDLSACIDNFQAIQMLQHGRVMKEHIEVSSTMLEDIEWLAAFFQKSLEYVKTLKPKPSKPKKK